ncbi:MAG: type 1 glutamine amidotransferase [Thiohalomonadaceae bacterium]
MKPVLMIQNDPAEGPGLLRTLLSQRGVPCTLLDAESLMDASIFTPRDYAGLVILGGGQGVYEQDRYPYLSREIALCRAFVHAGRPMLGLCLGAQLLAAAMGGEVRPNHRKEIGWADIELTEAGRRDPLFSGLPARFPVFHIHGDVFTPPPGVPSLATTALTPFQAVCFGPGVYGFQCHPEVDGALLAAMCRDAAGYMRDNGVDPDALLARSADYLSQSMARGTVILNRWIDCLAEGAAQEG